MKQRLDTLLVEKGLVPSRQRARGLIMAGEVKVDGNVVTKAGQMVEGETEIEVVRRTLPFVSRGGLKLEAALEHFHIDVSGKIAMDVGASTGGFTDCLLQRGAEKVYAVDVGYGLIDSKLRHDSRVILVERTNFRYIDRDIFHECVDIVTMDVSFISVTKIMPRAVEFLCDTGEILVLVKPQFEIGRGRIGKGGVVRDAHGRKEAVDSVIETLSSQGLKTVGQFESPIRGQKGNIEFFLHLMRGQ